MVIANTYVRAVDTISRYVAADGQTSVVSSCDIDDFDGSLVNAITSYTVGLEP